MQDRHEERATLTVLPAAAAAQAAYAKWGWRKVAQKHNPLPGAPVFDVNLYGKFDLHMVTRIDLTAPTTAGTPAPVASHPDAGRSRSPAVARVEAVL